MQNIVGNTSWISIVLILWGLVTEIVPNNWITWFAFIFFCFMGIISFAIARNGK